MEAIHRRARSGLLCALHWSAIQTIRETVLAKSPGPEKIVFGTGAIDRRGRFAIDKEHVVALSPPGILVLKYRHRYTHEVPAPRRFHPDVVSFTIEVFPVIDDRVSVCLPLVGPTRSRRRLTILGMEI